MLRYVKIDLDLAVWFPCVDCGRQDHGAGPGVGDELQCAAGDSCEGLEGERR